MCGLVSRAAWHAIPTNCCLLPADYVNVVMLSFARPDCNYTRATPIRGQEQWWASTGLLFSSPLAVVADAVRLLKAGHPNTRVVLSVGGSDFTNFGSLNVQCLTDLVADLGLDGEAQHLAAVAQQWQQHPYLNCWNRVCCSDALQVHYMKANMPCLGIGRQQHGFVVAAVAVLPLTCQWCTVCNHTMAAGPQFSTQC
jgi:hypothetical protein